VATEIIIVKKHKRIAPARPGRNNNKNTVTLKEQRNRFQIPQRENPRLRIHAVSTQHNDYSDEVAPRPGYGNKDKDDDEENVDDTFAKLIQEEERLEIEKKEKWDAQARTTHHTVIDPETERSYGRGARKTARARVWIEPGTGEISINKTLSLIDYFERESDREILLQPFVVTRTCGKYDVHCNVQGGGKTGQANALRLGIARALNHYNPDLYRSTLKYKGFLTRDARKVERKKIGLHKARKAPQWVRR